MAAISRPAVGPPISCSSPTPMTCGSKPTSARKISRRSRWGCGGGGARRLPGPQLRSGGGEDLPRGRPPERHRKSRSEDSQARHGGGEARDERQGVMAQSSSRGRQPIILAPKNAIVKSGKETYVWIARDG